MAALLKPSEAAELLGLSRPTITRYMQARDFADRISGGEDVEVPAGLAPYLAYNFPRPLIFGPRNFRIPADELAAWVESRRRSFP